MSVANALQGVLMLLTITGIGFVLAKRGLLPESMEEPLSRLTLRVAVPSMLFMNCQQYITRELLNDMGALLVIPFACMLLGYALARMVCVLFRIRIENRGVFSIMFALSNTIFIGLPVCRAIFGESALPLVSTYFPSNTIIFWTIGVAGMARDGGQRYTLGWKTVRSIFSPPLIGSILGTIVAVWGLQLPLFLTESLKYVGGLTVPVSLLLVGAVLSRMGWKALNLTREGTLTLAGRMIVMPALALGLCVAARSLGWMKGEAINSSLVIGVYTLEAAMPVMNQVMLLARTYNANYKLAAQMLTLTTLVSTLWIPALVFLLSFVV